MMLHYNSMRRSTAKCPTAKRSQSTTDSVRLSSIEGLAYNMRSCQQCSVFIVLVTLVALIGIVSPNPVQTTTQAEIYLSQFGYLPASARNPANGGLLDATTWTKAVQDFQSFAGLNVTGDLDGETLELMSLPRCGVRDKVGFGTDSRSKRYALQGSRWRVKALTYKISKYPKRLKRNDVDAEIARAFSVWSDFTDLSFTPKASGPVHIEIKFVESEHGDGDAFDGVGGTLAHAFFPVFGGDAHFDDAELWTIGSPRGTNLFQVAAHEFGHSLGLSHSDVRSALMAPFYRGFDPVFKLDSDDVLAIQALYGKKTVGVADRGGFPKTTQRPVISAPKVPRDDLICKDPKVDTLFNSADGQTYAFKGNKYYRLTENSIADGYPKLISDGWAGLPGDIDAAFTYKNGKTYFFKGTKYWRYNGRQMDGDYPKEISEGFTGIPDHLDAAMVWGGNGKIYFYKGSKFWRFDPLKRPPVKSSYPKPISNWEGLPNNIDAALQYTNGYTYFFKGDKYYRFNDRTFSVDAANPPFPRPSAHWWFGCKNVPSSTGNIIENSYEPFLHSAYNNDENDESLQFEAGNDDHQAHDESPEADVSRQSNSANKHYTSHNWSMFLATSLMVLIYNFKSR
ncbi:matrix metalloproteinase-14 isoform X1 [Bactrocera dorsalis]|uniref:Matrix metalloproteinase-14 isoform X1 n=1 Tax=Bactrocera dorsalis TaxID=27457 RepID=A0ABM3JDC5_BACDO|nr:matrix metalloproteinase-14 isoform X1 [Bactrocera dorsalis]XP_049307229.1 matrix metalloproteinase-14 isoform X1 [Bactrocera dorsalis]XP_049307230.1 matrix metalloproteinase-14 isoform X1 [Bactrocera dorsalis]XP_049307231.1 matrix metalloproteinase-14 isoform X1 [Bactrocera dorsalis]